jgi:hypothetical protein
MESELKPQLSMAISQVEFEPFLAGMARNDNTWLTCSRRHWQFCLKRIDDVR